MQPVMLQLPYSSLSESVEQLLCGLYFHQSWLVSQNHRNCLEIAMHLRMLYIDFHALDNLRNRNLETKRVCRYNVYKWELGSQLKTLQLKVNFINPQPPLDWILSSSHHFVKGYSIYEFFFLIFLPFLPQPSYHFVPGVWSLLVTTNLQN